MQPDGATSCSSPADLTLEFKPSAPAPEGKPRNTDTTATCSGATCHSTVMYQLLVKA